jgi:hypothetical protein
LGPWGWPKGQKKIKIFLALAIWGSRTTPKGRLGGTNYPQLPVGGDLSHLHGPWGQIIYPQGPNPFLFIYLFFWPLGVAEVTPSLLTGVASHPLCFKMFLKCFIIFILIYFLNINNF